MASFLSRYGLGLAFIVTGLALLGAGAAWSLAHDEAPAPAATPSAATQRVAGEGLALDAGVEVDGLPLDTTLPRARLDPGAVRAAPLPGVSFDRTERVEVAGVAVGADLHLKSGSHRSMTKQGDTTATVQASRTVAVPVAPPVALAAAAFTLAGLAAWLWAPLKSAMTKGLVLPLVGLYAKVTRAEVFDNEVRERIFAAIRERPGVAASDLARAAGVSWGTTIYHLDVLEQTRMVTSIRAGRYRRYFENGAALATTKEAVAILQNPVTASVVETVRRSPGATQKELAGATGMSPQALHWHLARLVAAGLVRKERAGRVVRHFGA